MAGAAARGLGDLQAHAADARRRNQITLDPLGEDETKVTTVIDLPDMDDSMDTSFLMKRLEEVARIREELIEAET